MNERARARANERTDEQPKGANEPTNERTKGRTDEWTKGRTTNTERTNKPTNSRANQRKNETRTSKRQLCLVSISALPFPSRSLRNYVVVRATKINSVNPMTFYRSQTHSLDWLKLCFGFLLDYSVETFSWPEYLAKTGGFEAPIQLFRQVMAQSSSLALQGWVLPSPNKPTQD